MFTLIVTVLAVLAVLGFLFRIADSTTTDTTTTSTQTPSSNHTSTAPRAVETLHASAHLRATR
jgi:hypothetical protein